MPPAVMTKPPPCEREPISPATVFIPIPNRTLQMHWLLAPLLALALLTGTASPASAGEHPPGPRIWFCPNPYTPNGDILNLWSDTAPWQSAAGKVDVLSIVHQW